MDIQNVEKIERHILAKCQKSSNTPIKSCSQVATINLADYKCHVLPNLSKFANATKLYATNCNLVDVEEEELLKLEDLDLSYNSLAKAPEIHTTCLFTLNLSHNIVEVLDFVLPSLMELDVSNNDQICFKQGLSTMCPKLRKLRISSCGLSNIEFCESLGMLVQLEAQDNLFDSLESFENYLPRALQLINITGTPAAKKNNVFEYMCHRCEQLRVYNNREYSPLEIEFSGKKFSKK